MFKTIRRVLGKTLTYGKRVAKLFMKPSIPSLVKAITDVAKDVSTQYPPEVRRELQLHGNHRISNIQLCKEVVSENTEFLLKALAGSKTWEDAKRKHGFDRFYHLFMIVTMENGSRLHIEKNEIMRISSQPRPCPDALDLGAPTTPITVSEMLDRTKQRIGDREFFTYDPLGNNCQNFINQLLRTLGLWNQTSSSFVFQDIKGLRDELPSYTRTLAKGLTDIGAFVNTAYQKTKDYIVNGEPEGPNNQTDAS
jgi:hypothetical protein